jgi:polysaccharide export outer membrane protein
MEPVPTAAGGWRSCVQWLCRGLLASSLAALTACANLPAGGAESRTAVSQDAARESAPEPGLDSAAQESAKERLFSDLTQGLSTYRLVPGDAVEVLYLGSNQAQPTEYTLGVGDRLRIEFHYTDEAARTLVVRPDGMITLPLKGDVMAAGKSPMQLTRDIEKLYADVFRTPKVSVIVEQFTSKLDDLRVSLSNLQRGRSQRVLIGPDGMGYLPYLPGIRLTGLTVDKARETINDEYHRRFGNLEVSVLLDTVTGNRVFVFGEVSRPGAVTVSGPMTVLQALASAGGNLPTGSLSNVKVLYWAENERQPRVRTLDLARLMERGGSVDDIVLPGNSTVYVPPTSLASTGRFVDQLLRQIFMFNGTSVSFQRTLN